MFRVSRQQGWHCEELGSQEHLPFPGKLTESEKLGESSVRDIRSRVQQGGGHSNSVGFCSKAGTQLLFKCVVAHV